jgi:hypothetical protein
MYYYKIASFAEESQTQGTKVILGPFKIEPSYIYNAYNLSKTSAMLAWYKPASDFKIDQYILERKVLSEPDSSFNVLAAILPLNNTYDDTGLDTNFIYTYRMCTRSKYYGSEYSTTTSIRYHGGWQKWK